jgi:hypothetical protein
VALAVVIATAATLLVRSLVRLEQVPLGFDATGVLSAQVALPQNAYADPVARHRCFGQLLDRLRDS